MALMFRTNRFFSKIMLVAILLVAAVLRFYRLGQVPPSLSWDETALGYNAYSLGLTGKDEYGERFPLSYFASFGDYKPPVYVYLAVLPVKIFGLNEFAVRFPSAFFGVLTVLITYFLTKELLVSSMPKDLSVWASLVASFLLAISPWHIIVSRQAFEANVATFLIVCGIFLFLKSLKGESWLIFVAAAFFGLSFYTFNSARLFIPLLLFGWALIFRKELWKKKRSVLGAGLLGLFLLLPLIPHLLSPQGKLRFKEVNIFSDSGVVLEANRRIEVDQNVWWARMIHNRRLGYLRSFFVHYLDHFQTDFLFFEGDINPKFSTRDTGQLYLIESLFLIVGFYFLVKNGGQTAWLILSWLIIGLVPAATARETPHALRTLVTLPVWQIVVALGIVGVGGWLKTGKTRRAFCFLLSACYVLSIFYFLHNLFSHWSFEYSGDWQYGYKEVAQYALKHEEEYDEIWVSGIYGRPYIFFLFHQKRHPEFFWKEGEVKIDEFGFYHTQAMGKYQFGSFDLVKAVGKKVLLVGAPKEIPDRAQILLETQFLDGETAFLVGAI